jgi:predicted alpha/beta hydrolase
MSHSPVTKDTDFSSCSSCTGNSVFNTETWSGHKSKGKMKHVIKFYTLRFGALTLFRKVMAWNLVPLHRNHQQAVPRYWYQPTGLHGVT